MFEPALYNNRKIRDFADILNSFERIVEIVSVFEDISQQLSSSLLRSLVLTAPLGSMPIHEMKKLLDYFRSVCSLCTYITEFEVKTISL